MRLNVRIFVLAAGKLESTVNFIASHLDHTDHVGLFCLTKLAVTIHEAPLSGYQEIANSFQLWVDSRTSCDTVHVSLSAANPMSDPEMTCHGAKRVRH